MTRGRYPAPWKIEEGGESFTVMDALGQPLCFIYFEDELQRRMTMRRISKSDACRMTNEAAKPKRITRNKTEKPTN